MTQRYASDASWKMFVPPNLLASRCSKKLGASKGVKPPLVGKCIKRLPTILEVAGEGHGEASDVAPSSPSVVLPTSLPQSLVDPVVLVDNASDTDLVVKALKDGCKQDKSKIAAWLVTAMPTLSKDKVGSGAVKVALENATGIDRKMLVSALRGSVSQLCVSPHGFEVLVTVVETMPVSDIGFVAYEMIGHGTEVARNRWGSHVLEAMTMHCTEEQMAQLETELAQESLQMSRHPYANSVVQHLLEYASDRCKAEVVKRLLPEISLLAMDRVASHVVEKALIYSDHAHQIAASLVWADKPSLEDIACSRRGSCVLVEIAGGSFCVPEFRRRLWGSSARLSHSKFGRKVLTGFSLESSCGDACLASPCSSKCLAAMAA
jgi:hypothetical protein